MSVSPLLILTLFCGFTIGWILGDHPNRNATRAKRYLHRAMYGVIAATILGLFAGMMPPSEPPEWSDDVTHIQNNAGLEQFLKAHAGEAVIIDFYADWCAPCRVTAPVAMAAAAEGIPVGVVDVDVAQDVAYLYKVEVLPTVMVVRDNMITHRTYGVYTLEELRGMVRASEKTAAAL